MYFTLQRYCISLRCPFEDVKHAIDFFVGPGSILTRRPDLKLHQEHKEHVHMEPGVLSFRNRL